MMNDNTLVGFLMFAVLIVLIMVILGLKKALNKTNTDKENTFKLSIISDKGHSGDEFDKCFRMSTIVEEDYQDINSNRISIVIMMEPNGKISASV
jgi:hypothetical protein